MSDDNPEHITAREFDNAIRGLTTAMADGFANLGDRVTEVKDELKAMNSKVALQGSSIAHLQTKSATQEVVIGNHGRKLEKIDTGYRHARKDDPDPPHGDSEPITMKDLKRALWVAGAVMTLIGGIVKYGPVVLKAIAVDGP